MTDRPMGNIDPQDDVNDDMEELANSNPEGTAYIGTENIDVLEGVSMTDLYQNDTDTTQNRDNADAESFDMLIESELREGETDDVMDAIEEGSTYIPPIDPPTIPSDDPQNAQIAQGFGIDAEEESQGNEDTASMAGDDIAARVRSVLLRDSATSYLADRIHLTVHNQTVIVRGEVDDLDDSDNLVAVLSDLPYINEVIDQTTVRGL